MKPVIDLAVEGLKSGGVPHAETFRVFFEQVYHCGYSDAVRDLGIKWDRPVPVSPHRGCQVCGIGSDGRAYGYVCSRDDCPTRVTCT
jgi:hypothetical protein